MIDKAKLLEWIKEELPDVAKMKQPLTYDQIDKLEAEFTKKEIWETLENMDNHAQLNKKYLSVYRTCRNWMRMARKKEQRYQQSQVQRMTGNNSGIFTHEEGLSYLAKKGIPFAQFEQKFERFKDENGKYYFKLR